MTSSSGDEQHLEDLTWLRRDTLGFEVRNDEGTYGIIVLATKDLDSPFDQIQAGDVEVVQEPTLQDYGLRDCAVRDPAGNMARIQELA